MQNKIAERFGAALLVLGVSACASHKESARARGSEVTKTKVVSTRAYMDAQEERLAKIPGTKVERVDDDALRVRLDSDVLFAPGSAVLSRSASETVEEVAEVLAEYPRTTVVINGYTDATGGAAKNQYLSERRAEAVGGAVVSRGVAAPRVVAAGHGETEPVATNASARGRNLNRRVEIEVRARPR